MAYTLQNIKDRVLNLLQKETTYQGFYTDSKVFQAINDSFTYLTSLMSLQGQGWFRSVSYITTLANTASYILPANISTIKAVRYLVGTEYIPMQYDDGTVDAYTTVADAGQYPMRYRIQNGSIVFNPAPQTVGTNFVQIETVGYPTALATAGQEVNAQFDDASVAFVTYRSASVLASTLGEAPTAWGSYEAQWYSVVEALIGKRNGGPRFMREFGE